MGLSALADVPAREQALLRVEAYLAGKPRVVAGAAAYALFRLARPARMMEVFQASECADRAALLRGLLREAHRLL